MEDTWVCSCLEEFNIEWQFIRHINDCSGGFRDVIQDIIDGKPISVLDEDDPLLMGLVDCPFCTVNTIEEMIEATAQFIHLNDNSTRVNLFHTLHYLDDHIAAEHPAIY